jgi:hypothetical protein
MLKNKTRMKVVSCTKQNKLAFNERVMYSFLVFRRSKGKGASLSAVRRVTGFDRTRTLPRIRQRLIELGLAEIKDRKVWALEPSASVREWFGWVRDPNHANWWERLAYWWLYLPAKKRLTLKQAGVWSMMISLHRAGKRVRRSGLPVLLTVDAKTIRAALLTLEKHGLCGGITPRQPGPEQENLFRSKKSAAYQPSQQWWFPDDLDPDFKQRLRLATDEVGQLMLAANWKVADATSYFQGLDGLSLPNAVLYRFLLDLPKFFAEVEQIHQGNVSNGKVKFARNCKGLLTSMSKTTAARLDTAFRKMDPQTRRFYLSL